MSNDRLHDENKNPFTMINNEIVRDGLTFDDVHEKMVYFVLKSHAVDGGGAFPSYKTIAKEVPCGVTKVKNCIQSLVDKKLISKRGQINSRGAQTSNVYTIGKFVAVIPEEEPEKETKSKVEKPVDCPSDSKEELPLEGSRHATRGESPHDQGVVATRQGAGRHTAGPWSPGDYEEYPFKNIPLRRVSSSSSAGVNEAEMSKLVSFFQKEIGMATGFVIDDMEQTLEETSYDLIQYALEQAVLNGARNWKYAKAIIKNYRGKNILTLDEIQLHEAKRTESFHRQNTRSNSRKTYSRYSNKPEMEEPKWLANEKDKQKEHEAKQVAEFTANVPDDDELNAILQDLKGREQ